MSLEDLLARTADRAARNENQTYPEHAGKAAYDGGRPVAPLPVLRPACRHEGAIVEPCLTCAGDLRSVRDCDRHERATRVFVSDKVRSCDRCPDYAPEGGYPVRTAEPAAVGAVGCYVKGVEPRVVRLPAVTPPRLPKATRTRVVCTVASGDAGRAMLAVSRPLHERYAARLGADYVVLSDPPPAPEFPLSGKFRLGYLLDHWQRVAFLDADALPLDGCPDLFAAVGEGEFGFHDDLPAMRVAGTVGLVDEYHEVRRRWGMHPSACEFIANTGVLVFDRSHREALAPPPPGTPLPLWHCSEQNWTTARMHDLGTRTRRLPSGCNYQWWANDRFQGLSPATPPRVILHFSGLVPMRPAAERLELLRVWAGGLT